MVTDVTSICHRIIFFKEELNVRFEIFNKKTGENVLVSEMDEWLVIGNGQIKYSNDMWSMEDYGVRFC